MASYFDQREQRVEHQLSIVGHVGEINFQALEDRVRLIDGLQQLRDGVGNASEGGELTREQANDVQHLLAQATDQATASFPDKCRILGHLAEAQSVLQTAAAAAWLSAAIRQAAEAVQRLF